jgi:hypothetical protein
MITVSRVLAKPATVESLGGDAVGAGEFMQLGRDFEENGSEKLLRES